MANELITYQRDSLTKHAEKGSILYWVQELNYPFIQNAYDATDFLIFQINDLMTNPHVTDADRWIFLPKDGQAPRIRFMFFPNKQTVRGIVYDDAFAFKTFELTPGIMHVPLGHSDELVYYHYYLAKYSDPKRIPKLPKVLISGYLEQSDEGFVLKSIYRNGWDGINQYRSAHKITSLPTEAYDDLYSVTEYGFGCDEMQVQRLMQKWRIPESEKQKLLNSGRHK